ncbi:MAG TPA: prepilin-type N-terminal cleavage/methylation domain-containing protein, partial [Candidatus Sulfotelmatobacter sp.]
HTSPWPKVHMTLRKQRGFSLLELMIVASIAIIMAGISFVAIQPILLRGHVDTAYATTLQVLRNTRQLAITQSHEYTVTFDPVASTILVQYQPPSAGGAALPPLQTVNTYKIPSDVTFGVRAGFPAATPDNFGTGIAPVDFGQGLGGGSLNFVTFMPDGSSRDTNHTTSIGNYNSGIVYITRAAGQITDSRAVTVWGATGRIRGWALVTTAGVNSWVQR